MEKILLSTTNPNEQRLAVVNNGILNDFLSLVPGQEDRKGNIYRGIIEVVEPSIEACFVDIGDRKKAFLQFTEIHDFYLKEPANGDTSFGARLKPGTAVLVKIVKDSRGGKGPLVSTFIDLASTHLVLFPNPKDASKAVRISRQADPEDATRIENEQDKFELPKGMCMIVRSHGTKMPLKDLTWQLNSYLVPFWNKIKEVYNRLDEPELIYEDNNIVNLCMREYFNERTTELICDQVATVEEAKQTIGLFMPALVDRIRMVAEDEVLFNASIINQIDGLTARTVSLPSGGELVIDITEAMIAIDINSKRSRSNKDIEQTAYQTNLEAAREIARRLRLANLAGLIVIDFIDMDDENNRRTLVQQFRSYMRRDKSQISIGEISRFGLLEMTRQNIGRALHETHASLCPACKGSGRSPTVAAFARTMLERLREACMHKQNVGTVTMYLPVAPATYLLNEQRAAINAIQAEHAVDIYIVPVASMQLPEHRLRIDKMAAHKRKKASFEHSVEQEIAMTEHANTTSNGKQRAAPAITSFKAKDKRPVSTPGFWSKLAAWFSGSSTPPPPPPKKNRPNKKSRKAKANKRRAENAEKAAKQNNASKPPKQPQPPKQPPAAKPNGNQAPKPKPAAAKPPVAKPPVAKPAEASPPPPRTAKPEAPPPVAKTEQVAAKPASTPPASKPAPPPPQAAPPATNGNGKPATPAAQPQPTPQPEAKPQPAPQATETKPPQPESPVKQLKSRDPGGSLTSFPSRNSSAR